VTKKALIILADGFEEIEAICVIDILRRAAINLIVCGADKLLITSARNLKVQTDKKLSEFNEDVDALILPGGSTGAQNLAKSQAISQLIGQLYKKNKIIAAICASPAVVLAPLGVLDGKKATCFPGMENALPKNSVHKQEAVVVDDTLITSQGPATALEFALKISEQLTDKQTADKVRKQLLA
jgi:4-methyl-5(b-hydroxyethyl)-thiazole monophosphate biosynthesis